VRPGSVRGVGLLALAMAAMSAPAGAAIVPYYRAGTWTNFGGRDVNGRLICGMQTGNPVDGREFDIKAVIGTPGLTFTASRPTWHIPPNTPIPVVMTMGGPVPWTVQGTGSGHEVTWSLSPGDTEAFEDEFRSGNSLTVSFPSGNEPPWVMSLLGSNDAGGTFLRCVNDYSGRLGQMPQPVPGTPPALSTQPFGAGAQPFAPPVSATPLPPLSGGEGSPKAALPPLPAIPPAPSGAGSQP
jgi:hypothetical protein